MDYAKESLKKHEQWKGKIEVVATVPVADKDDLSLAYTPLGGDGADGLFPLPPHPGYPPV